MEVTIYKVYQSYGDHRIIMGQAQAKKTEKVYRLYERVQAFNFNLIMPLCDADETPAAAWDRFIAKHLKEEQHHASEAERHRLIVEEGRRNSEA